MQLELTVCAALAALFVFIEICDTKPAKQSRKRTFTPKKNPCYPELICESKSNYPTKLIRRQVHWHKNRKWLDVSGNVISPGRKAVVPIMKHAFQGMGEENICRTQTRKVRPTMALDESMKMRYIVNVDGFQQIITFEYCLDENHECFGNGILPNDFKTFCKQSYTTIRLVFLNSTGHLEYGNFSIPSTCVCSYQRQIPTLNT